MDGTGWACSVGPEGTAGPAVRTGGGADLAGDGEACRDGDAGGVEALGEVLDQAGPYRPGVQALALDVDGDMEPHHGGAVVVTTEVGPRAGAVRIGRGQGGELGVG
jgi:hypothetical protein